MSRVVMNALFPGLFLVAGACASGAPPTKVGTQPSWRQAAAPGAASSDTTRLKESARVAHAERTTTTPPGPPRPMVFAPSGPGVDAYNIAFEPYTPESPLFQVLANAIQEAARAAGKEPPVLDPRLFKAAGDMAQAVPEDRPLSYAIIEFAMQRHGIIEPSPHMVPVAGDLEEPASMLEALGHRLPEILRDETVSRIGIGSAKGDGPGRDVLVVLLQASHIETNRIPRALAKNGRVRIEGTIASGYREPAIFVTRDDGVVVRQKLQRRGRQGFRTTFACQGRTGQQQLEITAENERGSAVLANFPVWCDAPVPKSVTVQASVDDLTPVSSTAEAELMMFRLVNRDRKKYGLPPLDMSPAVSDVARAHSEEMRDTGVVAHVSPLTGAAHDRVERANIPTSLVMENIARAYGVGEAQEGLMNSPGHRTNILSDKATHVGIGIAFHETEAEGRIMFFTQVFIREPPVLSAAQAQKELHTTIGARASAASRASELDAVAQGYVDQVIVANLSGPEATSWREAAFQPLRSSYARIATAVVAVTDLETIDMDDAFSDAWITHYGLGVAKGPPGSADKDTLFVVLVLAEAR